MTEPIYDFELFNLGDAPVDDPETQALLAVMEHDPEWIELQARLERLIGKMQDYHYVVTTDDDRLMDFPMPSVSDERALKLFDEFFISWNACGSFIPASQFKERTYVPNAIRLELITPDGMRRLADAQLG